MFSFRKVAADADYAAGDTDEPFSSAQEDLSMKEKAENFVEQLKDELNAWFFPDLPSHYSLRKKILISKSTTTVGALWDVLMICMALIVCALYVVRSYTMDLHAVRTIFVLELVITQFFVFDLLLNFYLTPTFGFLVDVYTIIDILTILPVYLAFGLGSEFVALNFLRCLRILRLMKIFKTFKFVRNASGVRRQILNLILTFVSLIFLAAGIVQLMENDVHQLILSCKYINENTDWEPSCASNARVVDDRVCDCSRNYCARNYLYDDKDGKPSAIKCSTLTFFDAVYFISITVTSVGYGDIAPVTQNAKLVVILFILATVVIIPARIAELQKLLSLSSPYQNPYLPQNNERHVIVTGHTSDKRKLERFLKEFFHPDRQSNLGQDSHCVILSTSVPNEDIRSLILGQALESKITWVLGSALAVKDLKRVKAKQASAIFFLCNTDQNDAYSTSEDAANVLRALSASNFNTEIECMVQVLRPENSAILKESEIKFILCLDEFKTAVQARNAVVPGFSTFIENIFHSFGSVAPDVERAMPPWYKEYLHGAGMELYYAPLPAIFLSKMRYSFKRIAEAIYIEYDCIVLGVCNEAKTSVVFNPNIKDLSEFKNVKEFFSSYSVALIMADDQYQADQIAEGLADAKNIAALMEKCDEEEAEFPCRSDGTFAPTAGVFKKKSATHDAKKSSSPSGFSKFFSLTKVKSSDSNSVGSESDDDDDSSKGYTSEEFEEDSDDEVDENYIGYRKKSLQTVNGARIAQDFEEIGFGHKASIRPTSSPAAGRSTATPTMMVKSSSAQHPSSPLLSSPYRNKDDEDGDSDEDENSDDESEEADTFGEVQAPIRAIITQNTFGLMSTELQNASNLSNHVIVHGCSNNFQMFVSELRRPAVKGDTYHPILIVDESVPSQWSYIKEKFNDVYFLKGKLAKTSTLHRVNIKNAFSLTLLAARNEVAKVDDQANNSSTLFNYLKLEAHLPKSVFVSVELTSSSNMAVLNATIMRRVRESVSGSNHTKADPKADDELTSASSSAPNKNQNIVSPSILANIDLDVADASIKARVRRKDAIFDGDGRFASKRTSIIHNNTDNRGNNAGGARSNLGNIMGPLTFPTANTQQLQQQQQQQAAINRRASTLGVVVSTATSAMSALVDDAVHSDLFKFDDALEDLCDAMDSHHVLPVFASAKAFMPSSFESLLVQSYYVKLTPIICEKFVIGQLIQTVMQIAIPKELVGRRFVDLYRLFLLNQVLCFGLFRAPQFKLGATLPYVYIAPPSQTILNANDRVYAFGSPANMARAKISCQVNLRR